MRSSLDLSFCQFVHLPFFICFICQLLIYNLFICFICHTLDGWIGPTHYVFIYDSPVCLFVLLIMSHCYTLHCLSFFHFVPPRFLKYSLDLYCLSVYTGMCDNFPAYLNIDYVRVFQAADDENQVVGCSTPTHPSR